MRQPEKFISIAYPQIDFLIPNDYVISSVGVKDLDMVQLMSQDNGFFNFDDIAQAFNQVPRESDLKTMIVIRSSDEKSDKHISIMTTQECKVCTVHLADLNLFPDFYSEQFKKFGFLACGFKDEKIRLLLDVNKTIAYMTDCTLEEL